MPLTADDFVQENSGAETTAGTSHVVTLPSGTTEGNTVLVFMNSAGSGPSSSGWTQDRVSTSNYLYAFRRSEVPAAETSWTFTTGGSIRCSWYAVELSNVDAIEPLDASATNTATVGNGGTLSTGTTSLNAGLSTVVFAVFGGVHTASVTESWSGYTNGFEEVADLNQGASAGVELAVARKFVDGTTGTFSSTGTLATTGSSAIQDGMVVAYRAADAPVVAPLHMFLGFEQGTHGGTAANGLISPFGGLLGPIGTWGTNYLIQGSSARNGNYGLRIVQSGGAAYVYVGNFSSKSACFGFNVRVVSATGTVVVATTSDHVQLLYDSTATKFGVRCGTTGTVSWESGTTALNTWRWIDIRIKTSTSTYHADWRIETGTDAYTDQSSAELTGQSIANVQLLMLGYSSAQTMTADYDDVCVSAYNVAYPLGPHKVTLLTVDPSGTPSVSGTSSNFSVFTSNGTLGAWNATNARNALDEVPPTVSASADGVVQTATASGDYMEFPMQTYACTSTEVIAGVRMLAAAWGGTGSGTGTLGIRGHDGTTETTLIDTSSAYDAGSPTAISSTEPLWRCAMWPSVNGWTQAELDAAVTRVGFSTDATPDMGIHAIYLEAAIAKTRTVRIYEVEGGLFAVDKRYNPNTIAPVSYLVTTAPDRGATFSYTLNATPSSTYVGAGASQEVTLVAEVFDDVSDETLQPDALP